MQCAQRQITSNLTFFNLCVFVFHFQSPLFEWSLQFYDLECFYFHSMCILFQLTMSGLDTNGWPIARGNWISYRASEIYIALWQLPCRATGIPCRTIWLMQGSLINLRNIHYNDKLDESPDLFTTSFASGSDPWHLRPRGVTTTVTWYSLEIVNYHDGSGDALRNLKKTDSSFSRQRQWRDNLSISLK